MGQYLGGTQGPLVACLVRLVCLAGVLPSASLNFTKTGQGRRLSRLLLRARTTRRGAAPCSDLYSVLPSQTVAK